MAGQSNAVFEISKNRQFKPSKPQHQSGQEQGDVPGKSIKIETLGRITNGSFDLSGSMGVLLVEAKRVSFTSLFEIRKAFSSTFASMDQYDNATMLLAALADKRLDVLSLLRNLLVHRAGVADAEYIEASLIIPTAPQMQLGHKIPLDGEITRTQVETAVSCAMSLVKGVDQWLSATKPTK